MRVLIDIDCVLADFVTAAVDAHGLTREKLEPHWPVGAYDMTEPFGRALGRELFTESDFWAPINGRAGFWSSLKLLPWAPRLVSSVAYLTDEWFLTTSPSRCPSAYKGKARWVLKHFGVEGLKRLILTPAKHVLAGPGVVLVDDHEVNCRRFTVDSRGRPTGGAAVLFPTRHNRLHEAAADPMPVVKAALAAWAATQRQEGL